MPLICICNVEVLTAVERGREGEGIPEGALPLEAQCEGIHPAAMDRSGRSPGSHGASTW